MVISELALGLFTNLLYESFKNIPEYISDASSKVYDKAIEEFSNKNYKLTGIQIDTFFHQENVEKAIEKYLKNPDKLDCSNILINEFFELFSEEDFSHEDADLILNSFFEIIDAEIEEEPELRDYLELYLAKETYKTVQETNQGVQELSQGVKEISHKVQEIHEVINGGRENQDKKESGVDFEKSLEKYLNKIIDEDTKISKYYTELSAKEILPRTLKVFEEENNIPQEFEVLELVDKEVNIIISGESGSGKTTTLKWLNFTFATEYLENKKGSIPLYVELNSYIRGPFYNYFKNQIKKKGLPEVALKALLEEEAIIFLDGFDLLSSTENFSPHDEIENFIAEYSNCKFIVSSRPGFFGRIMNDFKVWELEKLTDKKIQIFIKRYIEEKELAEALTNKILNNPELKYILTNPMMLYLAVKVAVERKRSSDENSSRIEDSLPQNRSELYEIFVSDLFKYIEESRKPLHADRVQIENALTDLFFKLQCINQVLCKYKEALQIVKKHAYDPIFRKTTSQDILKDSIELGLLKRNNSKIGYGFHQSFQEYFAAIKLKELFENGVNISEALSHPKWEEVVIFTSEMLDSAFIDEFIDLMILKGELFLASKCVNKASEKTKKKLCALLADKMDSKYKLDKINSIESLERIGNTGISIIAKTQALRNKKEDVQKNATESPGQIKSEKAVQSLKNELKDKGFRSIAAAFYLSDFKSEKIQLLVDALKYENKDGKSKEVQALGNVKYELAFQQLINAMKHENKDFRERISAMTGSATLYIIYNDKQLKEQLESENELSYNIAYEALQELEKERRSKIVLFKDEKFLKT